MHSREGDNHEYTDSQWPRSHGSREGQQRGGWERPQCVPKGPDASQASRKLVGVSRNLAGNGEARGRLLAWEGRDVGWRLDRSGREPTSADRRRPSSRRSHLAELRLDEAE